MYRCLKHGVSNGIVCPDCEKAELLKRIAVDVSKDRYSSGGGRSDDYPRWVVILAVILFAIFYDGYLVLGSFAQGEIFVGLLFF